MFDGAEAFGRQVRSFSKADQQELLHLCLHAEQECRGAAKLRAQQNVLDLAEAMGLNEQRLNRFLAKVLVQRQEIAGAECKFSSDL